MEGKKENVDERRKNKARKIKMGKLNGLTRDRNQFKYQETINLGKNIFLIYQKEHKTEVQIIFLQFISMLLGIFVDF